MQKPNQYIYERPEPDTLPPTERGSMNYISYSGGKDSTAMLLRMVELDMDIADIVFFDGGWEFPQTYEHIFQVEKFIKRKITVIKPRDTFENFLKRWGWPNMFMRWCTTEKNNTLNKITKCWHQGIAADEINRVKKHKRKAHYPLIEWGWTERDCLNYCYERGFTWGGLYTHFRRVSCFCCPLKGVDEFRRLYKYYPDQWNELKRLDSISPKDFKGYKTVADLQTRFEAENMQLNLLGKKF